MEIYTRKTVTTETFKNKKITIETLIKKPTQQRHPYSDSHPPAVAESQ